MSLGNNQLSARPITIQTQYSKIGLFTGFSPKIAYKNNIVILFFRLPKVKTCMDNFEVQCILSGMSIVIHETALPKQLKYIRSFMSLSSTSGVHCTMFLILCIDIMKTLTIIGKMQSCPWRARTDSMTDTDSLSWRYNVQYIRIIVWYVALVTSLLEMGD